MTAEEYFGDWIKVINKVELAKIMTWLKTINPNILCPSLKNIFKAFRICPFNKCHTVFLGMDPYPQPRVATGILFGNNLDIPEGLISPSLRVIKKAINATSTFDNSMHEWARQGILMINSALTCEVNKIGSHINIWRPFVSKLIYNISINRPDMIFVMFGTQAQSFSKDIQGCKIINVKHPAYYARMGFSMPSEPFDEINMLLERIGKSKIIYT